MPAPPTGDLFEFAADAPPTAADTLVDAAGHLRGDHEEWLRDPAHLAAWARAALDTAHLQHDAAAATSVRLVGTVLSESAAAVLCLELRARRAADRPGAHRAAARRRRRARGPTTDAEELATRRARDALVLRHVPGRESTDLRNPAQVLELLNAVGVDVPNTRKWVLEPFRRCTRWSTRCSTGAGRADRHDLRVPVARRARRPGRPAAGRLDGLRRRGRPDDRPERAAQPARAAAPGRLAEHGHVFVRADLGQIEPRVLAVVSRRPRRSPTRPGPTTSTRRWRRSSASSARSPRWRCSPRCTASAAARPARRSGTSNGPTPWRWACSSGRTRRAWRGEPLRTYGGRAHPRPGRFLAGEPVGADPALDAARGRFARNAMIQGSAAELFKAWAATVRHVDARPMGGPDRAVPARRAAAARAGEHADEVAAAAVERALDDAPGGGPAPTTSGSSPTPGHQPLVDAKD